MTGKCFFDSHPLLAFRCSLAIVCTLICCGAAEPPADAKRPEAALDAKDTRLALEDIRELRRKRIPAGQVADTMAERGRAFEVTAEIERELRSLGFGTAQLAEIKDASPDPLVPGKSLSSNDAQRDATMELMRHVATKSGAAIEPVASRHVTLWAAKNVQKTYLADLRKAEKSFHTKCAEPIRSGLDKRTTHVVLLNNRVEYAAWWHAMLELDKKLFEVKDNPGFSEQIRRDVLKSPVVNTTAFSVFCAGEIGPEWTRRCVAFSVGYQYAAQLTDRSNGAVQTGFGNWTETVVCGSPAYFGGEAVYGQDVQSGVVVQEDWGLLVKQRLSTRKATPLADLLKADQTSMSQPLYAERWALVGLLNQQAAKFGKLLLAIKHGDSDLAAIEKIYGWNEKELSRQWRVYGMSLRRKKAAAKRD